MSLNWVQAHGWSLLAHPRYPSRRIELIAEAREIEKEIIWLATTQISRENVWSDELVLLAIYRCRHQGSVSLGPGGGLRS